MAAAEDVDPEDFFRAQVEANFFGVVRLTQAVLPVMRTQRAGHIIQISSVGGRLTRPGLAAYQSSKWAVTGYSGGVVAQEVAPPLGIKVTVLEPGGMRTDWAGSSMRIAPIRPEYEETVGGAAAQLSAPANLGASDPAKVAALLLDIVDMDTPARSVTDRPRCVSLRHCRRPRAPCRRRTVRGAEYVDGSRRRDCRSAESAWCLADEVGPELNRRRGTRDGSGGSK